MSLRHPWIGTKIADASLMDRVEARARRVMEKWGAPQAWLQEFQDYLNEPRMTQEEFWVRYTLLRMKVQPALTRIKSREEAESFYRYSDYMLWRNVVHRRHSAWRRVLATMPSRWNPWHRGLVSMVLWEIGCGIAPVSTWVAAYRPKWRYLIHDLESPHRDYAAWRLRHLGVTYTVMNQRGDVALGYGAPHVITLLDVLEHLADPFAMAEWCISAMNPGSSLHWNFVGNERRNDLDLATEEQQAETTALLYGALDTVYDDGVYRVGIKR